MKTFINICIGFVVLVVATILILPFVVDVDKYRPMIVDQVNQRINGKFSLGKLKLSLWGQIRVEAAGLELVDATGRKVVSVKDAYFHVPFSSIFGGSPVLNFNMLKPEVDVFKPKKGQMNVMALMKPAAPESAPTGGGTTAPAPAAPAGKTELPSIVVNARLGVRMEDAKMLYADEAAKSTYSIENLNLVAKDISASRPITIEIDGRLNTKMPDLTVDGPFSIQAKIESQIMAGKPENVAIDTSGDFSKIHIKKGSIFEKKAGVTADFAMKAKSDPQSFELQSFKFRFLNAEVTSSGKSSLGSSPSVDFKVESNLIDLKPWNEVVPMLNDYNLSGQMQLTANANGPASSMEYGAKFFIKELSAKAPHLKTQPVINADIVVVTDKLEKLDMTFKAPGNDLHITGKIASFTKPKADFAVVSTGMDLDQMVVLPPLEKKKPGEKKAKGEAPAAGAPGEAGGSAGGTASAQADLDAMVDPIRENEMMAGMQALLTMDIKFIKVYGSRIDGILVKFAMQDLNAALEKFQMAAFDGTLRSSGNINLKPKTPSYRFQVDLTGLDLKKAVESQFELMKNTLIGKANFKMDISGSSFNTEPAMKNLKGKGSFRVADAQFTSIDVGKMAGEAINKGLEKVAEKVPQAKGKKLGDIKTARSYYEFIAADFSINDGNFDMPNFIGKAKKGLGIDIKGDTHVGLLNDALKARWELIDTHNTTKARDIGVEALGVKIDHILAEGNEPVKFPISVSGTLDVPVYSYTEVPEYLANVAFSNVTGAAKGRAKAELDKVKAQAQKKIEEEKARLEAEAKRRAEEEAKKQILDKAPPAVKKQAEDLKKKLFGR